MSNEKEQYKQSKENAKIYKNYYIGAESIPGDSRYLTVLFDKEFNIVEECICSIADMKQYIDEELEQKYLKKEKENE